MNCILNLTFALFTITSSLALAEDQRPKWINDAALTQLKNIGIDADKDISVKGNYRWEYKAKKALKVDEYTCPVGSSVAISRNIFLIMAPQDTPCTNAKGEKASALKLNPDDSATTL